MTDEELEDRHTVIKGNDYYMMPPLQRNSCRGCERVSQPCTDIGCDGGKYEEEFILIDYSPTGIARYIAKKLEGNST